MDDVFDEEADELTTNKNEFNRIMANIEKEGLVEGIEEGKQKIVQDGFDKGYEIAFKCFHKINLLKGVVRASLNVHTEKADQLKSINESLINLEKRMIDELTKEMDGQTEFFNTKFDEIKQQLQAMNLFRDLDEFLNES